MTEPNEDPMRDSDVSLGRPMSLDPVGREIARMKVSDALFTHDEVVERPPATRPEPRDASWVLVVMLVVVLLALAILIFW